MNDPFIEPSSIESMVNEGGAVSQPDAASRRAAALVERVEATYHQKSKQAREAYQTHPFLTLFLALSVGVLVGAAIPVRD